MKFKTFIIGVAAVFYVASALSQTRPWETFKIFIPDFQLNKTFFQSFFQKPIFVMKKIISSQLECKSSIFAMILLYGASTPSKSYSRNNTLAVMRVCIIGRTGSRRPHKEDSVNPLFY